MYVFLIKYGDYAVQITEIVYILGVCMCMWLIHLSRSEIITNNRDNDNITTTKTYASLTVNTSRFGVVRGCGGGGGERELVTSNAFVWNMYDVWCASLKKEYINIPLVFCSYFIVYMGFIYFQNGKNSWIWITKPYSLTIQPNSFSFCLPQPLVPCHKSLYVSPAKDKRINANTRLTNAQAQLSSAYIHHLQPRRFFVSLHLDRCPQHPSISFKTFA